MNHEKTPTNQFCVAQKYTGPLPRSNFRILLKSDSLELLIAKCDTLNDLKLYWREIESILKNVQSQTKQNQVDHLQQRISFLADEDGKKERKEEKQK